MHSPDLYDGRLRLGNCGRRDDHECLCIVIEKHIIIYVLQFKWFYLLYDCNQFYKCDCQLITNFLKQTGTLLAISVVLKFWFNKKRIICYLFFTKNRELKHLGLVKSLFLSIVGFPVDGTDIPCGPFPTLPLHSPQPILWLERDHSIPPRQY